MFHEKISFEISHLKSLLESESSCVSVVKNFKGKLTMLPFHLGYLKRAVKELLDQKVSKYDPELNGIILGHSNIKVINYLQHFDSWRIHLSYIADIYIFSPSVGKNLTGLINKKSEEHIGCLMHNAFNASIPKPRDEGEDLNIWKHAHGIVKIGDLLDFTVSNVDFSTRVPYISGIIIGTDSGCEEEEDDSGCCQDSFEVSTYEKKKKEKRKSKDVPLDDFNNEITSYHDPDHISELLRSDSLVTKKGKRKKSETFHSDLEESSSTAPKKKKIKKERFTPERVNVNVVVQSSEESDMEEVPSLKKIKVETVTPLTSDDSSSSKKSKSKRSLDKDISFSLEKVKREPSAEEMRSLLIEGTLRCFSPKPSSSKKKSKDKRGASSDESNMSKSESKKQKRLSYPVEVEDIKLEHDEEMYEPKSKKRKRPDSSVVETDDSFVRESKKKKSRKSKNGLE